MGYQEELQRLVGAKESMRQSIIAKGVDVPESAKIEEYPDYIAQITGGGGATWDPDNPTLEGLKYAIDNDIDVSIGTEIPDTYNGQSNPLIVAQKLDSTNNSTYGSCEGMILFRKYVEPTTQRFGDTSDYSTSAIDTFLQSDYYDNCSSKLKSLISDVVIPYRNTYLTRKWFIMSSPEVNAATDPSPPFAYWKQQTGFASPNAGSSNGRIMRDRSGNAKLTWLRTRYDETRAYYVSTDGSVNYTAGQVTSLHGVLPACFIAKGGN